MPSSESGEVAFEHARLQMPCMNRDRQLQEHRDSSTSSAVQASPTPPSQGRSPLAVLLSPEMDITGGERDIRVEDYLNDKIQTAADFGNLASLLANVEIQKQQLDDQLRDAKSKLEESKKASANHASAMLAETKEFARQQESVQNRLMIVTNSSSPEEATQRLQGPMEKLRRVELAKSYIELLKDVDDLAKDARRHLPANPKEALKPYIQLKELAISLVQLQEPAEDAAPHLVNYVKNTSDRLWVDMKKIMSDEFESILQKSHWPESSNETSREWSDCFEKLLDLQAPEILAAREPLVLLPMSVLCKSFVLQFRYHFFSDRPTNHPHQLGDYFFEWFLGTVVKWEDFLRDNVAPVLAAHFRGNILAGNSIYVDPVAAFITALLPVLKEKVDALIDQVSNEPQYLSKFIHQLMVFDDALRTKFGYDAGNSEYGWKGLTWDVLDKWFDRWSQIEKDFALERYREIINSPDSGQIDPDSTGPGKTKTTYGAQKVSDLIQSVTDQYNKLRRFSHKVRFLISIQAEILDQYFGRLNDSLEAYKSITTTVGRTLHGISKEEQAKLKGIGGLESLCKVFGSADHIMYMLKDWINEEFFVDLWDQLQHRAKKTDVEDNLAGTMTYNEVKECTSEAVGSEAEGSVFDVTIENYEGLRKQAERLITQALKYSFPTTFRQYLNKPQWTTIGDEPIINTSQLVVTAELDQPLQILKENMMFLHKNLAYPPFRRIWREAFESLESLLFQEVLLKQDFTTLGAARFMQDITAIQSVVESCVSSTGSNVALSMPKLKEGATLLNLPLEPQPGKMSLKEACSEIFATGAYSDQAFETLGITQLKKSEARKILPQRVESRG